jgi:hypothetical protein
MIRLLYGEPRRGIDPKMLTTKRVSQGDRRTVLFPLKRIKWLNRFESMAEYQKVAPWEPHHNELVLEIASQLLGNDTGDLTFLFPLYEIANGEDVFIIHPDERKRVAAYLAGEDDPLSRFVHELKYSPEMIGGPEMQEIRENREKRLRDEIEYLREQLSLAKQAKVTSQYPSNQ